MLTLTPKDSLAKTFLLFLGVVGKGKNIPEGMCPDLPAALLDFSPGSLLVPLGHDDAGIWGSFPIASSRLWTRVLGPFPSGPTVLPWGKSQSPRQGVRIEPFEPGLAPTNPELPRRELSSPGSGVGARGVPMSLRLSLSPPQHLAGAQQALPVSGRKRKPHMHTCGGQGETAAAK